jgi:hypothetical protein
LLKKFKNKNKETQMRVNLFFKRPSFLMFFSLIKKSGVNIAYSHFFQRGIHLIYLK